MEYHGSDTSSIKSDKKRNIEKIITRFTEGLKMRKEGEKDNVANTSVIIICLDST